MHEYLEMWRERAVGVWHESWLNVVDAPVVRSMIGWVGNTCKLDGNFCWVWLCMLWFRLCCWRMLSMWARKGNLLLLQWGTGETTWGHKGLPCRQQTTFWSELIACYVVRMSRHADWIHHSPFHWEKMSPGCASESSVLRIPGQVYALRDNWCNFQAIQSWARGSWGRKAKGMGVLL